MTAVELRDYKGLIRLSHRVAVYVPSESGGKKLENHEELVDGVSKVLSELCGGATATPALGYWVSAGGSLVKENVTIVYAHCDRLELVLDGLLVLALGLKQDAGQDSIAFEVDGELYLI